MPDTLDIQKVISTSTSNVSIEDLSKKGFKQVKVLNQAAITKLIGEAVDQVLRERAKEISKEERDKVIKEARSQFETLAKRRLEKERGRIDELETAHQSLSTENETLKKRLAASVEVQASRDQALARAQDLEAELAKLKKDWPAIQEELARRRGEAQALQGRAGEMETLRKNLHEREKEVAALEGQLQAKNEELERAKAAGPDEAMLEKLLSKVTESIPKGSSQTEASQIMLQLDGLSRRLANISMGGGAMAPEDAELRKDFMLKSLFEGEAAEGVQSNIGHVKIKEKQATGVKGALAKLKKLQQGGGGNE